MSESKHTPGPWKHIPWHIEEASEAVRAPDGWLVCTTESSEDARLIAAAPDLLASLKRLSELSDAIYVKMSDGEMQLMREAWEVADAAIAKAEGRS